MIFEDYDNVSDDTINEPNETIWGIDDRYALIAFLLLSVDNKPDTAGMEQFDAFIGIKKDATIDNEKENDKQKELKSLRYIVVRECSAFLESLNRDESYCDSVIAEIESIIQGNDGCGIGNGYSVGLFSAEPCELPGGAHFIFDFLKMVIYDGDCSDNQKKILKYLAKKWKIDKPTLLILENSVKSLDEINSRRIEIKNSEISHREAVAALANLDMEEQIVWKNLGEVSIINERAIDAENYNIGKSFVAGFFNPTSKKENEDGEESSKNDGLIDRAGDAVVDGICKIGEIICAPFDWLTEKITGWM